VGWIPEGFGKWEGFNTCVAIGQFDESGYPGMIDRPGDPRDEDWIIPYGCEIEVRRVREGHWQSFDTLVGDDSGVEGEEVECYYETHCVGANIWAHEGCYKYLEAWLNQPPSWPAVYSKTSSLGFSLPGELYEIATSRKQPGRSTSPHSNFVRHINHISILVSIDGTLPAIDYGGIEDSCRPFRHPSPSESFRGPYSQFQEHFLGARRGSRHTGCGIAAGLRGKSLVPSIMKDFRCWMFMRPDV
jgi:hypothetical protein